jgi:hypothetical protein
LRALLLRETGYIALHSDEKQVVIHFEQRSYVSECMVRIIFSGIMKSIIFIVEYLPPGEVWTGQAYLIIGLLLYPDGQRASTDYP